MTTATVSPARFWNVSDEYWSTLTPGHRALYEVVRPIRLAAYEVDVALNHMESFLIGTEKDVVGAGGSFDLEPDYQRGHVWNDEQRSRFVEAVVRGSAPGRILFNCPGWSTYGEEADIPSQTFECIDGLQRLTTLRRFMRDEVTVFNGLRASDLAGSPFDPRRLRIKVAIYEFRTRVSLLQFYLDLNAGGTVHAPTELARVRALLEDAQRQAAARPSSAALPAPARASGRATSKAASPAPSKAPSPPLASPAKTNARKAVSRCS